MFYQQGMPVGWGQPTHRYPACGGWGTMGQALGLEAGVLPLLDAFIVLPASVFPAPQWV